MSICSIHGFNHIVWSKRMLFERLIWVCVIIISLIFCISKGQDIFHHHLYRPTVVTAELDYKYWKNEFPSVTICQTGFSSEYDQWITSNNLSNNSEIDDYLRDLAFKTYEDYADYEIYANGTKKEYLKPEQYLDVLLQIVAAIEVDPNEHLTGYGRFTFPFGKVMPVTKMITEFGICSTLNPHVGLLYTPKYFNKTQISDTYWEPIFYKYISANIRFETRKVEADHRVMVHSSHEVADITTKSESSLVGYRAVFQVTSTSVFSSDDVKYLSTQQKNCINLDDPVLEHSPWYSYNLCRIECRIKLSIKYCGCIPYYYRRNGEEICNMTGMYCLSKYADELINLHTHYNNDSICDCLQCCETDLIVVNFFGSTAWLLDTAIIIEIYSSPHVRYVRHLVFSRIDVIVQIGGILGLCLGCSVLSIIEIIYFMTLRFYWGVIKGKSIKSSL